MSNPIIEKYAALLTDYCVSVQEGDKVLVRSSVLAEDLVREIYKCCLKKGASAEIMLEIEDQESLLTYYGNPSQLEYVPMQYAQAMDNFDAYILIKAPKNLRSFYSLNPESKNLRQNALKKWQQLYFKRTATLDLKRTFCTFPTHSSAQEAGMNMDEYTHFVWDACMLYDEKPMDSWLLLKERQQGLVDFLNSCTKIRYLSGNMDISYSTQDRTWINSHGTTNMPSGEVYTSPVEDSVSGFIYFDYPIIYNGTELQGVRFVVKDGYIQEWSADQGAELLNEIMSIPGARRFGEAAIGTNDRIQQFTKNILFDEKIGGTVHMAIGQSYLQAGGKNESAIHIDMIADMKKDGQIYADGKLIYEKGRFLEF
jgi:aminopeptidase